ncbi:putative START-like domain superfamily protein [Arabidopsis thaliana]|nr:hypothetical protein ISN45_At01g054480 [Arabidopsis thaliana x Arabidopsis arenosa]KAG7658369.1 hypothetical protein ISN44_As01g053450 [Arabidopsis suecica]
MALRRLCEMQFLFSLPPKLFWDSFFYHMTHISNKNPSEIRPWQREHMTIESVDHETRSMTQRFTVPEFFEGYKMITSTTKVNDSAIGLYSLVDISVEYDKTGPEIKDLDQVQFLVDYINELVLRTGGQLLRRLK